MQICIHFFVKSVILNCTIFVPFAFNYIYFCIYLCISTFIYAFQFDFTSLAIKHKSLAIVVSTGKN